MAFVTLIAGCYACGRQFSCNPHKVPTMRLNGAREPVCRDCMDIANARRKDLGLAPLTILPGAYEPGEEGER